MTIARRGLKVKVMGQANAVGPTSVEGSFSSYACVLFVYGTPRYIVFC